MKHFGDICKLNGAELPPVDVIIGGSPCQDLSIAGTRSGLSGERSGLFMEQIRIIKEMRERGRTDDNIRPCRYAVWENVPGAFSSGTPKGEDFRIVLEEFCKIFDPDAVVPLPDKWANRTGALLGEFMTHSTTDSLKEEDGFVSYVISMGTPPRKYCLTLNCSEKPRVPNPTKLSQILEEEVDPKYRLSPRACKGILNRAEKRGKALPEELKTALERQDDEGSRD